MGNRKCAYRVLVEKPEKRRQLGGTTCRWEYNINMDFQGVV